MARDGLEMKTKLGVTERDDEDRGRGLFVLEGSGQLTWQTGGQAVRKWMGSEGCAWKSEGGGEDCDEEKRRKKDSYLCG